MKAALQNFEGTLLLVSHDRDFLQGMANTVYEFKDQKIREYLGDINFFLEQKNVQNMREIEKKDVVKTETSTTKIEAPKNLSYEEQKAQKALQNKLSKIESNINQLEKEIAKDESLVVTKIEIPQPFDAESFVKTAKLEDFVTLPDDDLESALSLMSKKNIMSMFRIEIEEKKIASIKHESLKSQAKEIVNSLK